jgi:hypothetical protein
MAVLVIDLDGVIGFWDEALSYHMNVSTHFMLSALS